MGDVLERVVCAKSATVALMSGSGDAMGNGGNFGNGSLAFVVRHCQRVRLLFLLVRRVIAVAPRPSVFADAFRALTDACLTTNDHLHRHRVGRAVYVIRDSAYLRFAPAP
jgi:hypothetical protein